MLTNRPATRDEILAYYGERRVQFETYVSEVSDCRTQNGVRHIRNATAKVRNVDGVPTVRRRGQDFELFAHLYDSPAPGLRPFVACPTIIKRA